MDKLLKDLLKKLNIIMKQAKAEQKYIWVTTRKLREVANAVRGMKPQAAAEALYYLPKRGALPLRKVIKSAISNAQNMGMNVENLVFHELMVNQGRTYKRGIAVSRGQFHPIAKRTSHIKVVLVEKENKK